MPSGRQLFDQLIQSIRRQYRAGKTVDQILKSTETKKLQTAYSQVMGLLNDYQLKRIIHRQTDRRSPKRSVSRSPKRKRVWKRRSPKKSPKRSRKH